MKKLLAVAVVTLMASGAAFAGTLAFGFLNDDGSGVGAAGNPSTGTATFIRIQNFGASSVSLTAVMRNKAGTQVGSNTGSLVSGDFFSWRPRFFQGFTPSGTGATENGSMTVFHTGAAGTLGGNVTLIHNTGNRLAYLVQEQI